MPPNSWKCVVCMPACMTQKMTWKQGDQDFSSTALTATNY